MVTSILLTKQQNIIKLENYFNSFGNHIYLKRSQIIYEELPQIKKFFKQPNPARIIRNIKNINPSMTIDNISIKWQKFASQRDPISNTLNPQLYQKKKSEIAYLNYTEYEFDINQFKCINETYGHEFADRILDLLVISCYKFNEKIISKNLTKIKIITPDKSNIPKIKHEFEKQFSIFLTESLSKTGTDLKLIAEQWLHKNTTNDKIQKYPLGKLLVKKIDIDKS